MPVSSRLKTALVHPAKDGLLTGVRYSPDGKRLIAGSNPAVVIQVWDVPSGKQLTKIATGYSDQNESGLFFVSADWKTVYTPRERSRRTRLERDGRRFWRIEADGDVRAWDLESGELRRTFKHTAAAGITSMTLAPDGATFATLEGWAADVEEGQRPKVSVSLWEVKTGRPGPLPESQARRPAYSPDSKLVAVAVQDDEKRRTNAVKVFEVQGTVEKLSIPLREAPMYVSLTFSPNGKLLMGQLTSGSGRLYQDSLRVWDATSGKGLASLEPDSPELMDSPMFSPDGQTLAATNRGWQSRSGKAKLYLFDVRRGKLAKTISFMEKEVIRGPVFSTDGQWIAVITQEIPADFRLPRTPDPRETPQARIHLIEAASGELRETLVAPQGHVVSACFSPDGKTLATGSSGKVHLWDLEKPAK